MHAPLSTRRHDEVLAGYFVPDVLLATKPSSDAATWGEGDSRSLVHDCWLVQTDAPEKRKDATKFAIPFDTVVDIAGGRLTAPERDHDRLTKKIACLTALTTGIRRRRLSAQVVFKFAQYYDWHLRWRLSLGIGRNADVGPEHFEDYLCRLKGGDILDLVPIVDRIDRLQQEVAAGTYRLPVAEFAGQAKIEWPLLAAKLGVSVLSVSRSPNLRAELIDRIHLLAPQDADALLRHIAERGKTEAAPAVRSARTIEGLLEPWDVLSHLSEAGLLAHDLLQIRPFAATSMRSVANAIGRGRNRTETLLPPDFLRLLEVAAKWVVDYADHVLDAYAVLTDPEKLDAKSGSKRARQDLSAVLNAKAPAGFPPIWLSWRPSLEMPDALCASDAVKHLMTACAILIGGFGARRAGEITSVKAGCIAEEVPGVSELSIYIEKTLRDLDRIPVPAVVKSAVAILEKLTTETRRITGEDWLFRIIRTTDGGADRMFASFRLDRQMNAFAAIAGLPLPEGWAEWRLKPHQLRRGFAICYYHGFLMSSLDALSRFLRHYDPEMTRIYVTEVLAGAMGRLREQIQSRHAVGLSAMSDEDRHWLKDAKQLLQDLAERGEAFDEVRCDALVHRLLQMWDGSEKPIGQGAARLYADLDGIVERAAAEVRIGARTNDPAAIREPLERQIRAYAKTHYLEPVPGLAAHCTCRPGDEQDLAAAACLKARSAGRTPWAANDNPPATAPDHAFSGTYVCLTCTHCAAFSENLAVIADKEAVVADAVRCGASQTARSAAAEKLAALKQALKSAKTATKDHA